MAATIRVREDRLRPITFHPSPAERRLRWTAVAVGAALAVQAGVLVASGPDPTLAVSAGTGRTVVDVPAGAVGALVVAVRAAPLLAVAWAPAFCRYVRSLRRGGRHVPAATGAAAAATAGAVALAVGAGQVVALVALCGAAALSAAGPPAPSRAQPLDRAHRSVGPALAGLPWVALGGHLIWGGGPAGVAAGWLVAVGAADAACRQALDVVASRRAGSTAGRTTAAAIAVVVDAALAAAVAWLVVARFPG